MSPPARIRRWLARACALALPPFVLAEVNYPQLTPQSQLALFTLLGIALCFLAERGRGGSAPAPAGVSRPADGGRSTSAPAGRPAPAGVSVRRITSLLVVTTFAVVSLWLVVQSEPIFARWWLDGQSLGGRAGAERGIDLAVGAAGLVLVVAAAWRSLGPALPALALAFLAYGRWGDLLPDALLPHRGYPWERLVGQTFLHSQGVYGIAVQVMFSYVFPFLIFGALLEATGVTRYILDASRRLLRRSAGGPAKVAVLASGLAGSLSGSAVANTATTGTFTIPMMKSAGFPAHLAAGLEAAASSGGALMPPVMGAGAYMMLEIIDPPVSYLEVIRAALLPAVLYYLSLFLIVHFQARRLAVAAGGPVGAFASPPAPTGGPAAPPSAAKGDGEGGPVAGGLLRWEGAIFLAGLAALVGFLAAGMSVARGVTLAMATVLALALANRRTRPGPRRLLEVLETASRSGVALIAAAAAVGVVLGVVTLTGVGARLPALLLPLAENHLLPALAALMVSSLILGMGLPSAVCYLLLATLVGPVLDRLGVIPLAAHLFIFYFGMMSMVTPPVALAGYTAASIAGAGILRSSNAAFRFALVGFTLPYLFVFRPQLLMLAPEGGPAAAASVALAVALAALGIAPLAAALAGYLRRPLSVAARSVLFLSAALALFPGEGPVFRSHHVSIWNLLGIGLFLAVLAWPGRRNARAHRPRASPGGGAPLPP